MITVRKILKSLKDLWCPYCRRERAELNKLHKAFNDKGFVILSVSNDRAIDKVKKYLKKFGE